MMMCPAGQTNCGGACGDTTSNASNCAAYGRACAAGQTCSACASAAGGAFGASTCGNASWDTSLAQISPARATAVVCNDDACGTQSTVNSTIPAGVGIHALYVDGFNSGSSGTYRVAITRP